MGWIRISDDFYDNDKLGLVGPLGVALHVVAMGFCNRNLTDGYFARNKARLMLDFDGICVTTAQGALFTAGVDGDDAVKLVIEWMVAADLWHEQGHDCDACHARPDGGEPGPREYLIHDYLKYQPSKAEIEQKRDEARKRMATARDARSGDVRANNHETSTEVNVTPNPNPNPRKTWGRETVDTRGLDADGLPPRTCPDHPHGTGRKCGWCKDYRINRDAIKERRRHDELAQKREAKTRRENCSDCGGLGQVELADGSVARCKCREVSGA